MSIPHSCRQIRLALLGILSLAMLLLMGCGTKDPDEILINLNVDSANDPFAAAGLIDVIFLLSQPNDPTVQLVFPQGCADPPLAAGCGFSPTAESFRLNLELIDKDTIVIIEIRGRDASGNTLFIGTSNPFTNDLSSSGVNIDVALTS